MLVIATGSKLAASAAGKANESGPGAAETVEAPPPLPLMVRFADALVALPTFTTTGCTPDGTVCGTTKLI
jgi:hypothetical protein